MARRMRGRRRMLAHWDTETWNGFTGVVNAANTLTIFNLFSVDPIGAAHIDEWTLVRVYASLIWQPTAAGNQNAIWGVAMSPDIGGAIRTLDPASSVDAQLAQHWIIHPRVIVTSGNAGAMLVGSPVQDYNASHVWQKTRRRLKAGDQVAMVFKASSTGVITANGKCCVMKPG